MYTDNCSVTVDEQGRQRERHGTSEFPAVCNRADFKVPGSYKVMSHWHDSFEVIVAQEGSLIVGAGNAVETLDAGSGCFIDAGVVHNVCAAPTDKSLLWSIVFHPRLIGSIDSIFWQKYARPLVENQHCQFIRFDGGDQRDREIVALIREAWTLGVDESFGFEIEVRYRLSKIIARLAEGSVGHEYVMTDGELRDMERLKLMIGFIENNFAENITLGRIAKAAAVSESECIRCFKRSTALAPIQFLNQFRLLRAAELLRSTRLKVSDVADRCGFLDMSYFAKSFKQLMNASPTDYRRKNSVGEE